jgi:hypothetical protein
VPESVTDGPPARRAEQPRVLHRDDRLVGKGAHQLDLPLGERRVAWRVALEGRVVEGPSL